MSVAQVVTRLEALAQYVSHLETELGVESALSFGEEKASKIKPLFAQIAREIGSAVTDLKAYAPPSFPTPAPPGRVMPRPEHR